MRHHSRNAARLLQGAAALLFLAVHAAAVRAQSPGFYPAAIGDHGTITVASHDTYYDGSDGTLSVAFPLPPGATKLQFRVTGGVITDSSDRLASPDGLYSDGRTPYNSTARYAGTYNGVPVGSTTGIDPAVFGVFFNPSFTGTAPDSDNYRSDSGITPDPRTLALYAPSANQPFHIGDGFDSNNPFVTSDDSYVAAGQVQTFSIPAGATQLLLGIGADVRMSDNQNGATTTAFVVHVYDDVPSTVAARLAFTTQPGGADAPGAALAPQPVIAALNMDGNVDTTYSGPVTLSLKPGTGAAGASVTGTATVNAVGGIATFANIGVNKPGTGFVLAASGGGLAGAYSQPFSVTGSDHGAGFHPSAIGQDGVLTLDSHDTYYDSSDGKLFAAVPIPAGATKLQFRVTGGVITDGSGTLASADGLYADGRTPYNSTAWYGRTYNGVPVGSTTGIDPAVFGVFFDSGFTGAAPNSDNYRSDSGITPDPRTLSAYEPQQNQPFWIGDGFDANNPFVTSDDSYIPAGGIQTYTVPAGATELLLGIGADVQMSDNQNGATTTAFRVHVYDNSATAPAVSLAFSTEPRGGQPGAPLAIQPVVTALDASGHVAYGFSGPVAVALKTGTGASGAALSGTKTVNAVDGVAHFSGLSIDKAGLGYQMLATASGLAAATSAPFHVPSPLIFNAAADFSATANPNGAWSYGWETTRGAAFQLYSQFSMLNGTVDWWNQPGIDWLGVYYNPTGTPQMSADTTFAPGQLSLHPGRDGQVPVLRWTAPASGVYRIKARYTGITASPTSSEVFASENGALFFDGFINLNGYPNSTEFTLAKPFNAGDTLDFAVGCGNGNCGSDTTAVDVLITTFPDLDVSGGFDMADVLTAMRLVAGLQAATPDQVTKADFASAGRITLSDVLYLLRTAEF